jgi:hypothetical protein
MLQCPPRGRVEENFRHRGSTECQCHVTDSDSATPCLARGSSDISTDDARRNAAASAARQFTRPRQLSLPLEPLDDAGLRGTDVPLDCTVEAPLLPLLPDPLPNWPVTPGPPTGIDTPLEACDEPCDAVPLALRPARLAPDALPRGPAAVLPPCSRAAPI